MVNGEIPEGIAFLLVPFELLDQLFAVDVKATLNEFNPGVTLLIIGFDAVPVYEILLSIDVRFVSDNAVA